MGDVGSSSKSVPKGAGEEDGKNGKQPVDKQEGDETPTTRRETRPQGTRQAPDAASTGNPVGDAINKSLLLYKAEREAMQAEREEWRAEKGQILRQLSESEDARVECREAVDRLTVQLAGAHLQLQQMTTHNDVVIRYIRSGERVFWKRNLPYMHRTATAHGMKEAEEGDMVAAIRDGKMEVCPHNCCNWT